MKNFRYCLLLLTIISCGKENPVVSDPVVSFTLTVNSSDGGNVSSAGGSYNEGQSVSITATPDSEYVFVNWSNGSTDNPLSITVNSNQTITANFEKRKYPLTVSITGSGTVSKEIISSGKTTTEYNSGSIIRLTANPIDGWEFSGWSGSVSSTQNSIEVSINESKTVTATFNEINSSTSSSTENSFNQDNAPSYITVNGQGEFTITVTAEKDGLIDITILPLEGENSYWDFYESSNSDNRTPKIKQKLQGDFRDIDPNVSDLITIHFINRPRRLRIEGTNMWVYNGNSGDYSVSIQENQMRSLWNSCVSSAVSSSIIQVYQSQQENLKTTIWPQAYQQIYSGGYSEYDNEVGVVTYPNVDEPTLFHEYAHGFDSNFIDETDRVTVQQSYNTAINEWQIQYGYVPSFTNTCDVNNQNCAPYQLYSVLEFFAVLSTAYHGFENGSHPTGLSSAPPLQNPNDILTYYPNMYELFVNIYGSN